MTSKEFWELSSSEQYDLALEKGVKIGSRENAYFRMYLYRLFDFHVEFKKEVSTERLWILLVDHDILLNPYLNQSNKLETP